MFFFKKIDIYLDENYLIRVQPGPTIGIYQETKSTMRGIQLTPERWGTIKSLIESVDIAMTMVPQRKSSEGKV